MKTHIAKFVIRLVDRLVPKDKYLIVYGCQGGRGYYDNSRYFFEWMQENHPEIKHVWLTREPIIKEQIEEIYGTGSALLIRTIPGLKIFLRSKTCVISHGHRDLDIFLGNRSNKIIICLWHGHPIKKIGVISDFKPLKNTERYDLLTVASRIEMYQMNYAYAYDSRKKQIEVVGTPRMDATVNNMARKGKNLRRDFLEPQGVDLDAEKLILYAPTYRQGKLVSFFDLENFNFEELIEILDKQNAVLVIRWHLYDKQVKYSEKLESLERIIFLPQESYPDVTDCLHLVDVLITDYSSLYFDFLLVNNPIIFIPYDLEEYTQKWGLNYPFESLAAGFIATDGPSFLEALEKSLNDKTFLIEKRNAIRDLFVETGDGNSNERIWDWINKKFN